MIKQSGFQTTFLYFGLGQGIIIVILALFLFSPKAGQVPAVTQNANVIQTRRTYQPTEAIRQPIASPGDGRVSFAWTSSGIPERILNGSGGNAPRLRPCCSL
jgi:hypothetical protein